MPKTLSSDLNTHIQGEVTTLCTLWWIQRTDGVEFFFTDSDKDITFNGHTYLSAVGYNRTSVENSVALTVDNLDVTGFLDSESLTENALRAGLFDFAGVNVYVVNWADLTQGPIHIRRGYFGEVTFSDSGLFKTELRGLTQPYAQNILEIYQPICRTDLGSLLCKIPIKPALVQRNTSYVARPTPEISDFVRYSSTPPPNKTEDFGNVSYECTTSGTTSGSPVSYDPIIGNTTTDGTAVFTARTAWMRSAVVASVADTNRTFTITVTESRANVDDWFKFGVVSWDTGNNAGLLMEVKSWLHTSLTVELFLEMPFVIQVGDKLGIYAGCDHTLLGMNGCKVKFNNVRNRRAEDFVPGLDAFVNYPDAHS